jgi:hypothetical protein
MDDPLLLRSESMIIDIFKGLYEIFLTTLIPKSIPHHYNYEPEFRITKKAGKIPAFFLWVYVNLIIRLPALITLRYFHFLQDRQEVQ